MKIFLLIIVLVSNAISGIAQYDSIQKPGQHDFRRKIILEFGFCNLNDRIEEQVKDFMYTEGLRSARIGSGGGLGWFGGSPKTPDVPESSSSYFIKSAMAGYTLNRYLDACLGYRSGFSADVNASFDKTVPISIHFEGRSYMAFARVHHSVFEVYSGMIVKEMSSYTYNYPDDVKTKSYAQHKIIPGITGGINLAIPRRQSFFKVLAGYNTSLYFKPYSIGPWMYQKKNNTEEIVNYELPPLDIYLGDHSFYFAIRFNIPVK